MRQNYIGSVSDDSLENATINGYISGIGDKYASTSPPRRTTSFSRPSRALYSARASKRRRTPAAT
ncbi:MAG: hypothetical protein ACLSG5_08680 [Oscillospiraceae bacterium]